jgi:hypothetical protein
LKNSAEKGGSEEGGLEDTGGCCRKIAAFYSGAIESIQAPAWSRCAAEAYVFTCKGRTVNGKMQPPAELLPRFLSRCLVLNFETVEREPLAAYLEQVWDKEHGPRHYPVEYFEHLADGMGVRDALNRLDSELLAPRPLGEISRILTDRKAAEIEQEGERIRIAGR